MTDFLEKAAPYFAAIALALSLVNLIIKILEYLREKKKLERKLKIHFEENLKIDEIITLDEEIEQMIDAGIPDIDIPPFWDFKYKGEIRIKNIGQNLVHIDSIKICIETPNSMIEIKPNTLENSILLEKGKSHTTNFYFEPEDKDLDLFIKSKARIEVLDLEGKKYYSDWGILKFPSEAYE